jgi:hypothetical protein
MQLANDADPRALLQQIFRAPTVGDFPGHTWCPVTPSRLWNSIIPCPDYLCRPPDSVLDRFPTTTYGRVIDTSTKWSDEGPHVYAMLSLRSEVSRISPHPGVRPAELDHYIHPWYITSDASLGPYNPSRYAQAFDPCRPWLGYHIYHTQRSRNSLESYNPVHFFDFSTVKEDGMHGGFWRRRMLKRVFRARAQTEDAFLNTLADIGDTDGQKLRAKFGPSLPFFDSITLQHSRGWVTWIDGRDALGYTLRYIAEILAIMRWLYDLQRQNNNPGVAAPINTSYSGTWVGTVTTPEEWHFLSNSPLPLFGLFTVAKEHPLYVEAIPGSLDSDEIYRSDPVISHFNSIPTASDTDCPLTAFYRPINFILNVSTVQGSLPPNLKVLPPGEALTVWTPLAFFHAYTTYLFNNHHICRREIPSAPTQCEKALRERLDLIAIHTTRPHLPSKLAGATDFPHLPYHPMAAVLPPRSLHDKTPRCFLEQSISVFFWPEQISKNNHETFYMRRYTHDLGNNDFLASHWPWPHSLDVKLVRNEDKGIKHHNLAYVITRDHKRIYVHHEPPNHVIDMLPLGGVVIHPSFMAIPGTDPIMSKHRATNTFGNLDDDADPLMGSGTAMPVPSRMTPSPVSSPELEGPPVRTTCDDSILLLIPSRTFHLMPHCCPVLGPSQRI